MRRPPSIPNVNSLASLLDRLVVEHLKRLDCIRDEDEVGAATQAAVIRGIHDLLIAEFAAGFADGHYEFITEKRTVVAENVLAHMESLVISNLTAGVAEKGKMTCLSEQSSDEVMLRALVALARFATERRADSKRVIDASLKSLIDTPSGSE